jgi:hypothetical protein
VRTCIFCGGSPVTREHLWPEWILGKIQPTNIAGFIGKNRNLEVGRELKVRTVCKPCNGGWMSDLEGVSKTLIEPRMDDISAFLNLTEQSTISAWTVKTAMVLDSTTMGVKPLFYTQRERDDIRLSSKIPPKTYVWLARYLGRNTISCGSLETKHRGPFGAYHGRISTLIIGSLALQVMTVHSPIADNSHEPIRIDPIPGPWDEMLVISWPATWRIYWPPILAFDDSKTIINRDSLADRWQTGEEVPLV